MKNGGFFKLMKFKFLKKPRRVFLLILLVVVLGVGIYYGRTRFLKKFKKAPEVSQEFLTLGPEAVPEEPILVKVYKVKKVDYEDHLPVLGTIKGYREIDLKFEINGMIDSFNFRVGERAEEGEIIATISQKDALLKLKYNEIEYRKYKKLYEIGSITKSKLEQAKLELESAKSELEKTYLYAPRDGVIGTKDVEVGEFVTIQDKVATLIDDSEVMVEVGIIEKDIGKVKIGQKAIVTVDTYPDRKFQGYVDNVSPVIEGKARTQTVKIKVKNDEKLLLPGMFARCVVAIYKKRKALLIPSSAVSRTEKGYVTYVVKKIKKPQEPTITLGSSESTSSGTEQIKPKQPKGFFKLVDFFVSKFKPPKREKPELEEPQEVIEEEGIVEERQLKIYYRSPDFVVVRSGIKEGEMIVIETQEKLKDGYKVIIAEVQEVII